MTTAVIAEPPANLPRVTVPTTLRAELLLTAMQPVSHHDPDARTGSNTLTFNRRKQRLPDPLPAEGSALPGVIGGFCAGQWVPAACASLLADLNFPTFAACALTRLFLTLYNSRDGEGVFTGPERYERLESRLRTAAAQAWTLRAFWDRLCAEMQTPVHAARHDAALVAFYALPAPAQAAALRAFLREFRSVVALARYWHEQEKRQDADYCAQAGVTQIKEMPQRIDFPEDGYLDGTTESPFADVPEVSANSLRHACVRFPGWLHLVQALGLDAQEPGQGPVPPGVEALFVNGGNIAAGAKQPSNPYKLAQQVRAAFPLLDLMGGVTDSFDLGPSPLLVSAWIVCRENRDALAGSPAEFRPNAQVSIYDQMDTVTLTRQATDAGIGQMIFSFETLAAGAELLLRCDLTPFARPLTQGAFIAAIETWRAGAPCIGGQSARGFGLVRPEWLLRLPEAEERWEEYEDSLRDNADDLRGHLADGTLGADARVCS